jgi:hypothetical protein
MQGRRRLAGEIPLTKKEGKSLYDIDLPSEFYSGGSSHTYDQDRTHPKFLPRKMIVCSAVVGSTLCFEYKTKRNVSQGIFLPDYGAGQLHEYTCLIVRNHLDFLEICNIQTAYRLSNRPDNINCR